MADAQVTVTPAPAVRLAFAAQPGNAAAGANIPQVRVEIQNSLGGRVTTSNASVTLSLGSNPGSGNLTGTLTVAAVNGVATFSNLKIDQPGAGYTLAAASSGLTGATSTPFNITAGAPTSIRFLVQPTNVVAGAEMAPMQVELLDALGNRASGSSAQVTLSLGNNPGVPRSTGTATVNASSGVATFAGLSLNQAASGYTLVAATAGLSRVTSNAFDVSPGEAAAIVFTVQPSNGDSRGADCAGDRGGGTRRVREPGDERRRRQCRCRSATIPVGRHWAARLSSTPSMAWRHSTR